MITAERLTKLSRTVQRRFAQHIELEQPPYSWVHSRLKRSDLCGSLEEVDALVPALITEWRAALARR